jgi:hypothetical protein
MVEALEFTLRIIFLLIKRFKKSVMVNPETAISLDEKNRNSDIQSDSQVFLIN